MAELQPRKFGFPLWMFLGCCLGAALAIITTLVLSPTGTRPADRFGMPFFNLTLIFAAAGTYVGHAIGAIRNPEAGHKPQGPVTLGVSISGFLIWLAVSAAVLTTAGILGSLTLK